MGWDPETLGAHTAKYFMVSVSQHHWLFYSSKYWNHNAKADKGHGANFPSSNKTLVELLLHSLSKQSETHKLHVPQLHYKYSSVARIPNDHKTSCGFPQHLHNQERPGYPSSCWKIPASRSIWFKHNEPLTLDEKVVVGAHRKGTPSASPLALGKTAFGYHGDTASHSSLISHLPW